MIEEQLEFDFMKVKNTYFFEATGWAHPFVLEHYPSHNTGFVEAREPMEALMKVIANNGGLPIELFKVYIKEPSPEQAIKARYLSVRAATLESAPDLLKQFPEVLGKWEDDGLSFEVRDKGKTKEHIIKRRPEILEVVK